MIGCVAWLILALFTMVSLIRWFEQATDAVDNEWWSRVILLVIVPPLVWLFPSKISAGRPSMVPRHEPVRGFGDEPKPPPRKRKKSAIDPAAIEKLKQKMKEQGMLGDDE